MEHNVAFSVFSILFSRLHLQAREILMSKVDNILTFFPICYAHIFFCMNNDRPTLLTRVASSSWILSSPPITPSSLQRYEHAHSDKDGHLLEFCYVSLCVGNDVVILGLGKNFVERRAMFLTPFFFSYFFNGLGQVLDQGVPPQH
jgi:hypothetical protein